MTQEAWDKKVLEFGGGILQSWVWGEFQSSQGYKVERFSENSWCAQIVEQDLMMSKKFWYSPRGPVGNTQEAGQFLRQRALQDHSVVFLRLEPSEPVNLPEAPKSVQPKENWVVGLEGGEDELLVGMKPKHRYNINLAVKKGVVVREAVKDDFLSIWKLLMETASRAKIKLHPQNYYLQMWEKLSPNYLKVFVSEYQGEPQACAIVSLFGHTATYLHGGSTDKKEGLFNYDLGGYSSDPNHEWAGISRFKKGFSGFEVRYPGTFDLVLSPLWYNVYSKGRKLRKLLR